MRVGPDGGPPQLNTMRSAPPSSPSNAAPTAAQCPHRPGPASVAMRQDLIDRHNSTGSTGVSALGDWVKNEWSAVAGAAHGLASAPGVVSKAWREAAQTNGSLAKSIYHTVDQWQSDTASARQAAIDAMQKTAGPVSKTASTVAQQLALANCLPLAVEQSVNAAIRGMPQRAQHALKGVARAVSSAILKLPPALEASARGAAKTLEAAAASQSTKASTSVADLSKFIGRTVGAVHPSLTGEGDTATFLDKVPVLRDTPVAGILLTGAAAEYDIRSGKSVADAIAANVGGTLVGTAAGSAVTDGLSTWIAGAAIADDTAAALGAVAATGPVGWAVAAGVVAGAAASYGVYKAVESRAGQDVINGVTQLGKTTVERGLREVRSAIIDAAPEASYVISSHSNVGRS